jgi:hypothetical protein
MNLFSIALSIFRSLRREKENQYLLGQRKGAVEEPPVNAKCRANWGVDDPALESAQARYREHLQAMPEKLLAAQAAHKALMRSRKAEELERRRLARQLKRKKTGAVAEFPKAVNRE